ncbi:ras-induced vulval development antagonist-domain-containing protein [Phycomyces blakesleeanus]|uniref:Ras-induced vulval development antagonist-domain-containing protein n=1 Tax=Phycomyces blakesleeanus TaxID=4837 RepID=A0ABR3AKJ1_PHYBL
MRSRSPSPRRSSARSPSPYTRRQMLHRRSPSPRQGGRDDRQRSGRRSPSYSRRRRTPSPRRERQFYHNDQDSGETIDGVVRESGETFFEYRKRVREENPATIWATSPDIRRRSLTPDDSRSHKKRRSARSESDSDDSGTDDSDDSERHKRRKHKSHKSSKKKHSSKKSSHKSKKRHRRSETPEDESDVEDKRERDIVRTKQPEDIPILEVDESQLDAVEDLWVEKQVDLPDDLAPVGPVPLPKDDDIRNEREYGGALLPGEGSAMAAYVQQGKRIPRRGEIGLSGDQISDYEKAGYVMSGSRHQRMNAVRLRKENQVISAEEKRLLLQHAQEQKVKRENEIISGFREILGDKFKKEEE